MPGLQIFNYKNLYRIFIWYTHFFITFPKMLRASPRNDADNNDVTSTERAPKGVTRVAGANA